jgi:hypothetical protein
MLYHYGEPTLKRKAGLEVAKIIRESSRRKKKEELGVIHILLLIHLKLRNNGSSW